MDLQDTETKLRDLGVRWVLGGVEDGAEMAGDKEEVAAAIKGSKRVREEEEEEVRRILRNRKAWRGGRMRNTTICLRWY